MSILQSRWETKTHPQFWTFGPKPRTTIHLFQSARYNSKTCSGAAPYDTLGPSPDPKLRIKSTTSRSCSSQRSACSSNHSWDVEKTAHGYWKAWIKRLWKSNTAYINNMCSCHNLISFMIQKLIVSHLWKLDNLKDTVVSNQPPKQPNSTGWFLNLHLLLTASVQVYYIYLLLMVQKSCTTRDVWNPVNTGIKYQPQLVSWILAINSISKCHDFDLWCLLVSFLSALGMLLRLHGEAFQWLSPQCTNVSLDLGTHLQLKGLFTKQEVTSLGIDSQ